MNAGVTWADWGASGAHSHPCASPCICVSLERSHMDGAAVSY